MRPHHCRPPQREPRMHTSKRMTIAYLAMAAALLAGLAGYFFVLAPATRALQTAIKWVLSRPFVLLWLVALRPFGRLWRRLWRLTGQKMRTGAKKRRKKQLKSKAQVLYNSNN